MDKIYYTLKKGAKKSETPYNPGFWDFFIITKYIFAIHHLAYKMPVLISHYYIKQENKNKVISPQYILKDLYTRCPIEL